jgi:hypothetical protein
MIAPNVYEDVDWVSFSQKHAFILNSKGTFCYCCDEVKLKTNISLQGREQNLDFNFQ